MKVLVDTAAWSLLFRRSTPHAHPVAAELRELILEGRACMLGLIRQEVLSGFREARRFDDLKQRLRAFPDLDLGIDDYETAAQFHNDCQRKGLQGSTVDFLIGSSASRREIAILTADDDFVRFARVLPIRLHEPRR